MKIIYVHHGLRNRGNPPSDNDGLLDLGKKDAENVAEFLLIAKSKGQNIKAIYTSPYRRCKETADIINKHLQVEIIDEPRFNEFQGAVSGETWVECLERIQSGIYDIVKNYEESDTVVCVTSGVNISAFISLAYKIPISEKIPFPAVPSCSPIGFEIDEKCFIKKRGNYEKKTI